MFDTDVCDDKKARQIAIVGTLGIPLIAENAMRRAPGPLTCADTFSRYSNDYFFLPGATGSAQLVVPPAVSAPRVAENCGLHATSGWVRLPLMLLTPAKRANDRSCSATPLPLLPVIRFPVLDCSIEPFDWPSRETPLPPLPLIVLSYSRTADPRIARTPIELLFWIVLFCMVRLLPETTVTPSAA